MTAQDAPVATTGQRRKGLATRQRILEAAIGLFAERPFDDVQVFEIAEGAGVAHGLMFHHFGTKRGIYLEAVHEISRRLFKTPTIDPNLPPYDRIRQLLSGHFRHIAENETLLLGYVRGFNAMNADLEAWAVIEADRARLSPWAIELFGFDPSSSLLRTMFDIAITGMDTLSVRWLQDGKRWDIDTQLVEAAIELFIGAFRAAARFDPDLDVESGIARMQQRSAASKP